MTLPNPPRKRVSTRIRDNIELALLYLVLIVMTLCFVVPFYWLIISALKLPSELFKVPVEWYPRNPNLDNFRKLFALIPLPLYLWNTIKLVFFNVAGSLFSCSLVAYGFARVRWPGREKVFVLVLVTMILPYQVVMIPQFLMFQRFGWIGTSWPLWAPPFLGNPFFIFLLRQFFVGIPGDLTEAGRIDGAGHLRIFAKICLPLAKPALATVSIFAFLRSWNDFIGPLIYLQSDRLYTLSIGIQLIRSRIDPKWEVLMAAGVMMTIPVLVIFFLMQKYFIQGIALSGIKG